MTQTAGSDRSRFRTQLRAARGAFTGLSCRSPRKTALPLPVASSAPRRSGKSFAKTPAEKRINDPTAVVEGVYNLRA